MTDQETLRGTARTIELVTGMVQQPEVTATDLAELLGRRDARERLLRNTWSGPWHLVIR